MQPEENKNSLSIKSVEHQSSLESQTLRQIMAGTPRFDRICGFFDTLTSRENPENVASLFFSVAESILNESFHEQNAYLLNNFVQFCTLLTDSDFWEENQDRLHNGLHNIVERILNNHNIFNNPEIVPVVYSNTDPFNDPYLQRESLHDILFYNTMRLAEALQEPLSPFPTLVRELPRVIRNGTFINQNILQEYFNNAVTNRHTERLIHLVNFYANSSLPLPGNINFVTFLNELDQNHSLLESILARYENHRGRIFELLHPQELVLEPEELDLEPYIEELHTQHNAHTNATEQFFAEMNLSSDYKKLDKEAAKSFVKECIKNNMRNSYLSEVFDLFIDDIMNNGSTEAQNALIEGTSLIHDAISKNTELKKEIIKLFLRYYIFENFIADSTEALTDHEVNALYHEMNSWSIPRIFPPHHGLFVHSCAPGMTNRVHDFQIRLNALIAGNAISQETLDHSDRVDFAIGIAASNIFQPASFQFVSPYIKIEKNKEALTDYATHVIIPRNPKRFREEILNKEYRHQVWDEKNTVTREIHNLEALSQVPVDHFLSLRLQNVNGAGGACWIRAIMQDNETETTLLRHSAANIVQSQLENPNVQNALLDGIATLLEDTRSANLEVQTRAINTFQNFLNGIVENEETRSFLDFLRTLSLPQQIEAFSEGVQNEFYVRDFLSHQDVLFSYVQAQFQRNNTWGSEADIRALAHARGNNLRIYTRSNQNGWDAITGNQGDLIEVFYDQNHYQIVQPDRSVKLG